MCEAAQAQRRRLAAKAKLEALEAEADCGAFGICPDAACSRLQAAELQRQLDAGKKAAYEVLVKHKQTSFLALASTMELGHEAAHGMRLPQASVQQVATDAEEVPKRSKNLGQGKVLSACRKSRTNGYVQDV